MSILIWGSGKDYDKYINSLKLQEHLRGLKVVGVTSNEEFYDTIDGYPFIPKNQILNVKFDFLVIASEKHFQTISAEAHMLGIDYNKMIKISVFALPNFDFIKYINIKKSNISIITNNCWGGLTYHSLGLPFLSPFINMFENENDYIKILSNLEHYLDSKLLFLEWGYEKNLKRNFPIVMLDDVKLYFNHYISFEEVEEKWYSRIKRINCDNLFVMMYTLDIKILEKFDVLPYQHKICFVPFESDLHSAYYIDIARNAMMKQVPFWKLVNGMASGAYKYYDVLDLLNGKINKNRVIKK